MSKAIEPLELLVKTYECDSPEVSFIVSLNELFTQSFFNGLTDSQKLCCMQAVIDVRKSRPAPEST